MSKYITNIKSQTILIDGVQFTPDKLDGLESDLREFLIEWFNERETVEVHTSGSTGTPKEMCVEKARMMNSAVMTLSFLNLKKGDTALLCLPLRYIAGKMMVVRALVGGLNLIPLCPSGHPVAAIENIPDFAAMIPMQVFNSMCIQEEAEKLRQVKHLIIGGGAIDDKLEKILKDFPNDVWSTYGMTETLSHIALRKINGKDAEEWYTPFPNITLNYSNEGTLIIDAPAVYPHPLVTNDLVEFNEKGQFRILGRKDNTINTGGIKVQIEQIEAALKPFIPYPFLITSAPDEKFGERVVLLIETQRSEQDIQTFLENAALCTPDYWIPKQIIRVSSIPQTETGKPDRARAKRIAAD